MILAGLAVVLLPWLLPVLEGAVTPYRSSEYIPLVCAFAVLLAAYMCRKWNKKTWVRMAGWMAAVVLLYNQAFEMNRWFHVDNMKYQDAIRFTDELALELEKNYDVTKPILVKGHHRVPYGITQEGYIPYWSKKYIVVSTFLNILDPDLLELYNTEYGYAYVQTPFLSIIDWGTVAFHHNDKELMKFMAMHGHDFTYAGNWEWYLEAEKAVKAMPAWPREGSIVDTGDYILVNLGE